MPNAQLDIDALLEQSAVWSFLHDLFRPPSPSQWTWLNSDQARASWRLLVTHFDDSLPPELPCPEDAAVFEEQFLVTFEVGSPEPLCPLIESHWNHRDPVPKILHEHMLFFRRFGLELRPEANETSDHLLHQLEFLAYLCRFEADQLALATDESLDFASQTRCARQDYLSRHLGVWTPPAASRVAEELPDTWAAAWLSLLKACVSEAG